MIYNEYELYTSSINRSDLLKTECTLPLEEIALHTINRWLVFNVKSDNVIITSLECSIWQWMWTLAMKKHLAVKMTADHKCHTWQYITPDHVCHNWRWKWTPTMYVTTGSENEHWPWMWQIGSKFYHWPWIIPLTMNTSNVTTEYKCHIAKLMRSISV